MKHFILILLMCSVVTTVEARDKWKPKYNEELIQMYEENEKLKAVSYTHLIIYALNLQKKNSCYYTYHLR